MDPWYMVFYGPISWESQRDEYINPYSWTDGHQHLYTIHLFILYSNILYYSLDLWTFWSLDSAWPSQTETTFPRSHRDHLRVVARLVIATVKSTNGVKRISKPCVFSDLRGVALWWLIEIKPVGIEFKTIKILAWHTLDKKERSEVRTATRPDSASMTSTSLHRKRLRGNPLRPAVLAKETAPDALVRPSMVLS